MAIRLVNTFEGGTDGATPTPGEAGTSGRRSGNHWDTVSGSTGTSFTYSNTVFAHGSKSLRVSMGTGTPRLGGLRWLENSLTPTIDTVYVRTYVRIETLPTDANARWLVFGDLNGNNVLGAVAVRTDGRLDLLNSAGTVQATSTAALSLNTWYRVEVRLVSNATTGSMELKLFTGANLETNTPDETVSYSNQNTHGGAVKWFQVGSTNVVTDFSFWYDCIELNDLAYPGPFAPPIPAQYQTLFANGTFPFTVPRTMNDFADSGTYSFGMYFSSDVNGKVYGAAWCNPSGATSIGGGVTPQIGLYPGPAGGSTAIATKTAATSEVRANWNYELFDTPLDITAGTTYMIVVKRTRYPYESNYFNAGGGGPGSQSQGNLTAQGVTGTNNNFFEAGGSIVKPTGSFNSTWYSIDVLFQAEASGSQEYWGIPLS